MSSDTAIIVENLTKTYRLYNTPLDRLKESLHPFGKKYHHNFYALNNVSFEIKKGDMVGIIGRNGSGKSTLLKLITGVLTPTAGNVTVNGRITALLELGGGFNPELTGIENVYFNGMLMGYSRDEMDGKLDEILSFADIGEFAYQPVKTYSSGMFVRLAFAVSINVEPEILIVDEALSVGDAYFQQKCMNRIKSFKEAGGAIIFVSHDLNAVKILCEKTYLLSHGEIAAEGDPENVINRYNFMLAQESKGESVRLEKSEKIDSYGNFKVGITAVEMFNEQGINSRVFFAGENVRIRIRVDSYEKLGSLVVGILIRDAFGQDIFGTNSYHLQKIIATDAGKSYQFEFVFDLNVGVGKYTLTAAAVRDDTHIEECFNWCDSICTFEVVNAKDAYFIGLSKLNTTLNIKEI